MADNAKLERKIIYQIMWYRTRNEGHDPPILHVTLDEWKRLKRRETCMINGILVGVEQ